MKVVFYADTLDYQYAGIFFYLRNLLDALHKYGDQHEYILVKSERSERYEKFEQVLLPTNSFNYVNRFFRYTNSFPNIIKDHKPDVVIEPTHFGPFRLEENVRRVAIIHDITAISHPHFHPRASAFIQTNFLEDIALNANMLITNSEYTKTQVVYQFGIDRSKIQVLYPILPDPDLGVRSISPIVEGPFILHVGTLEPRKNLSQLVKAFDRIRPEYDNLKLVLVGKRGWKTGSLDKAIRESRWREDIIMTDYVDSAQLLAYYQHASLCVFPTHIEGFGMPIAEALSHQKLILCNDHASLKEAGGSYVYYANANDLSSFCIKMVNLLNKTDKVVDASKHLAKFGASEIASRFENIISGDY